MAMPNRNLPSRADGNARGKGRRNFTHPDSTIFQGGEGWVQGYNYQAAVDGNQQVIVAVGLSNQAGDASHRLPMVEPAAGQAHH